MTKTIERVHNELEARALIKEAYSRGEENIFDNCKFYKHDGSFLFTCKIDFVSFELDYSSDGIIRDSITIEL